MLGLIKYPLKSNQATLYTLFVIHIFKKVAHLTLMSDNVSFQSSNFFWRNCRLFNDDCLINDCKDKFQILKMYVLKYG